jgi:hypothetical protein
MVDELLFIPLVWTAKRGGLMPLLSLITGRRQANEM